MTPNQGKTAQRLAAASQGYLERGDLLHAMPSAPLHTVLPPLLRTTSALLTELAGQGAVVRGEAACGIAADNLLTGRRPSSSSQACPEAPSVGPAACTGAARGTVGLTVTCLEPCPCRVNQSSLAAAPYPTRGRPAAGASDAERARARTKAAYYNQAGDPGHGSGV
jgi:hypothetical protein